MHENISSIGSKRMVHNLCEWIKTDENSREKGAQVLRDGRDGEELERLDEGKEQIA